MLVLGASIATCIEGCRVTPFAAPRYHSEHCSPLSANGTVKPTAQMDFTALEQDFFAAPFPAFGRAPNRELDSHRFPAGTALMWRSRNLLPTDGSGISSGIFFGLTGPITASTTLPAYFEPPPAIGSGASSNDILAILFPLDTPLDLWPINVDVSKSHFADPGGGIVVEKHLLSMVPIQGRPLRPSTTYVALVTTSIADASDTMRALCRGDSIPSMGADQPAYVRAKQAAQTLGVPCDRISALTVFRTSDPTAKLRAVKDLARSDFIAHQGACKVRLKRESDANHIEPRCRQGPFCVFSGIVRVPQYQRGTPPYFPYVEWGGGWPVTPVPIPSLAGPGCDPNDFEPSAPVAPWTPTWRSARVVVTIPHAKPPGSGYPVIALVRTGGGTTTDTLVDRGPTLPPSCSYTPCRGPAEVFQSVGFAGISIDGPLVGLSRNEPIELNEDLGIFDFLNPEALVDNIRQSAVELTLVPDILPLIEMDSSECEDAGGQTGAPFDVGLLALFSHSMGSTIAPLALANQPAFRVAIMSGAGGSTIENALYKKQPVPISAAASLLGYACAPQARDPQLSLLQWALEPSDAQSYAPILVKDDTRVARHVLMIQGLVDHYIFPPIADVISLAAGLDLGLGPGSCNGDERCDRQPVEGEVASPDYPSLADLLKLSGHSAIALSTAAGNVLWPAGVARPSGYTGNLTALVVQHRIDENRDLNGYACKVDGHEVIYESLLARHQYACFLSDFVENKPPRVRTAGHELAGCTP